MGADHNTHNRREQGRMAKDLWQTRACAFCHHVNFKPGNTMSQSVDALFRPWDFKGLNLANRIVMAPMTRSKSPGQVPGPEVAAYYRRRVEGGTGLIITEGTTVDHPVASNDVNIPAFHGKAALDGWAHVVSEVHAAGGKIMPQIWHTGTMRRQGEGPNPDLPSAGPSGLAKPGKKVGEPMTDADIDAAVDAFGRAAADAKRVGFDGVEIHGAHGYLIDTFFWDGTNARNDAFGGDTAKRTRFGADIVRACRAATGPDFPIVLRFSQWKQQDFTARMALTPGELETFLTPLAAAGVDIFHCSNRRFWEPEFEGSDMNLAGWTKKITGKPTITVGSVGLNEDFIAAFKGVPAGVADFGNLITMFERGDFDLVGVGRALLVDPEWTNKIRDGRLSELKPYAAESLAFLS